MTARCRRHASIEEHLPTSPQSKTQGKCPKQTIPVERLSTVASEGSDILQDHRLPIVATGHFDHVTGSNVVVFVFNFKITQAQRVKKTKEGMKHRRQEREKRK